MKGLFHIFMVVFATLCLNPMGGVAQTETDTEADTIKSYLIDEVIVTGTRTLKKIIDIPYSVQRIDNVDYKFDRKVSVGDVLSSVPGLFLQSRYGNHDVRISIRGFGSRSNSGIRGVRILLDGIPESEPDGQTRIEAIDFNSVGSIEIVKGNSSSLYTNAPGGVINFINDNKFIKSFFTSFNEGGSFDLRVNGFKTGIRTENYGFLTTYSYHHAKGYRAHSEDYWHILNTVLETAPTEYSKFFVYGYFVDGLIRLPGSLTREQFDKDPFQVNERDAGRDAKRITTKGRVGLRYNGFFDDDRMHEIDITGYGTMKYFERTAGNYRIISRNGIGASTRYTYRGSLFGQANEFSVGSDLLYQSGPIEEYDNIAGKKGDLLQGLANEAISNVGFYFQNSFTLVSQKLNLLLTGRYDKVVFNSRDQLLEVRNALRRFEEFTPKAALNYKLTPTIAAYTSYGISFDSPAGNELDNYGTSSKPFQLLNPDLHPQKSNNFELGVKGTITDLESVIINSFYFEATFFNMLINDEIVPFEEFGRVFFRNSGKTNRRGLELGADVEIAQGLRFKGSYTYSDFKYDQYIARVINNSGATIDSDFSGNIVPSVPKHNLSLALSYAHQFVERLTGFLKGQYLNVSGMYTDDQNSEKSGGYQIVNTTIGLDLVFDHVNVLVSGGINNIFDRRYVAFININSTQKEFYEAGEPRHYFASLRLGYVFE
ncbi:MAG: TonB-dependent receptor [Ignavibacteriae bacterium]|nr:TonB-dependent receptor [Ignavibacteriota bacterium]